MPPPSSKRQQMVTVSLSSGQQAVGLFSSDAESLIFTGAGSPTCLVSAPWAPKQFHLQVMGSLQAASRGLEQFFHLDGFSMFIDTAKFSEGIFGIRYMGNSGISD